MYTIYACFLGHVVAVDVVSMPSHPWWQENGLALLALVVAIASAAFTGRQLWLEARMPRLLVGVSLSDPHVFRVVSSRPAREIHESLSKYTVPIYVKNIGNKAAHDCMVYIRPVSAGAYYITANNDKGQMNDTFAFEAQDVDNAKVAAIRVGTPIYATGNFQLVSDIMFIPPKGRYQQTDPTKMTYGWTVVWETGSTDGEFVVDYSGWNFEARQKDAT